MFEGDFKIAVFPGGQRKSPRVEYGTRFTKHDLIQSVGKDHGQFDTLQRAIAGIHNLSRQDSDFLIQEILHATHGDVLDVNLRGIRLLGGTKD